MTSATDKPAKCLRCGRTLRVSKVYGPVCRAKIRAAAMAEAVAGFTAEQIAKIREALADGAAVLTSRPGVYRVVSSAKPRKDGTCEAPSVYLASVNGNCTCAWGTRRTSATARACYHVGIARVDNATRKAA